MLCVLGNSATFPVLESNGLKKKRSHIALQDNVPCSSEYGTLGVSCYLCYLCPALVSGLFSPLQSPHLHKCSLTVVGYVWSPAEVRCAGPACKMRPATAGARTSLGRSGSVGGVVCSSNRVYFQFLQGPLSGPRPHKMHGTLARTESVSWGRGFTVLGLRQV